MSDAIEMDSLANFSTGWSSCDLGRCEEMGMSPKWSSLSKSSSYGSALWGTAAKSNHIYQDVKIQPCMSNASGSGKFEVQWGGPDGCQTKFNLDFGCEDQYGNHGKIH